MQDEHRWAESRGDTLGKWVRETEWEISRVPTLAQVGRVRGLGASGEKSATPLASASSDHATPRAKHASMAWTCWMEAISRSENRARKKLIVFFFRRAGDWPSTLRQPIEWMAASLFHDHRDDRSTAAHEVSNR